MGFQEATRFEHVVRRDGEHLGNELCRSANGGRRVCHVHATRADVQNLLQDLAAGDALELALADALENGATGGPVRVTVQAWG